MPRESTTYEVLIASPGDVVSERVVIGEAIEDWNASHAKKTGLMLQARRWELDAVPEQGERPQAIINRQLVDDADMLIAVFSARLGSPTGVASSGTIEEIERLRSRNKPVFVYFSTAPLPRDHDRDQLRLLTEYKAELSGKGLYFDFSNNEDLRRKVTRHLASTMAVLSEASSKAVPKKLGVGTISLATERSGTSGDVRTIRVFAILENSSPVQRITEYMATVSVPSACMTFASGLHRGEIPSSQPGRRMFRKTEADAGVVLPGCKAHLFSLDLGIDQLRMKGTYLAGDIDAVLADKVTMEAVVGEERLVIEKPVSEIFSQLS